MKKENNITVIPGRDQESLERKNNFSTLKKLKFFFLRNTNKLRLIDRSLNIEMYPFREESGMTNKKAFTLVELIIVVTILAILATIAFVSFQGYTKQARDGNRVATLTNIEKGLNLFEIKSGKYPEPTDSKTISLSGTELSYQGILGESVGNLIGLNKVPTDPYDNEYYIYSTNEKQSSYQLLTYLEQQTSQIPFLDKAYANSKTTRPVKTLGRGVGILLNNETNETIKEDIDLFLSQSGTTYKVYIPNISEPIIGAGLEIGGGLQTLTKSNGSFSAPTKCPEGFVGVPGNPEFMQPGFCTSKYEMSYDGITTPNSTGGGTDWNTVSYSGTLTPVSKSGNFPIADITQPQAIEACKKIGGHLITNNEWMTIARDIEKQSVNWSSGITGSGYISNGVSNSTTLGCGGTNTKTQYPELTRNWATKTGPGSDENCNNKRQLKLSNGEIIWDFAGNVWEHVNKANTIDGSGYDNQNVRPSNACNTDTSQWLSYHGNDGVGECVYKNGYTYSNIGPATPNLNANNGIGRIWTRSNTDTANQANVFLRGGAAHDGAYAGVFTFYLYWSASSQYSNVGFRCSL